MAGQSEYKVPPFNEKAYLVYLFDEYKKAHGNDIRHLDYTRFSNTSIGERSILKKFPELVEHTGDGIKPHAHEWAKEAAARGSLVTLHGDGFFVTLTKEGYAKAYRIKHPILHFCKDYWQWVIGTILTVLNVGAAALRAYLELLP